MRSAVVQLAASIDAAANRATIADLLAPLSPADELDLVVLPEGAMHDFGPTRMDLRPAAEPLDGPFVQAMAEHAQRLRTTLVAGMFERRDDPEQLPYNTLVALGPDGSLRATYRKIHLYDSFGYRESERLGAGEISPIVIDVADRRVGLMTCYDLRFPELGRALVDAGADVIAVPAAWVAGERKVEQWRLLVAARALENTVDVLASGQCGRHYTGHSLAVDATGSIVAEAGDEPAVLRAELDRGDLERIRGLNPSLANRRMGSPTR